MSDPTYPHPHHWLFDLGIASSSAIEWRLRNGNTDSQEFYHHVDYLIEVQNRLSNYIEDVQVAFMRMNHERMMQQQSTKEVAS